jgi:hypothetical protein
MNANDKNECDRKADDFKPGQIVVYMPGHSYGDPNHPDCETGVVSSIGSGVVFVRFGPKLNSESCLPSDLQVKI